MARLTIQGTVSRKVPADCMKIEIAFMGKAQDTASAIEKAHQQCEMFLERITDCGISEENIMFQDDSINRYVFDKTESVMVKRSIEFCTSADLKMGTYIINIIKEHNLDCNYDISFLLSDEDWLHEELLKEAIQNSRKKAEIIAGSLGENVIGADEIQDARTRGNQSKKNIRIDECFDIPQFLSETPKSDNLALPEIERDAQIEIVWITEKA